jgi:hypothetical protein
MAMEGNGDTNNTKTQPLRKLLDEEGDNVSLIWVLLHKGIAGNEQADVRAKTALKNQLHPTEKISSHDLNKWVATKAKELQTERWSTCNNEIRERKSKTEWTKDTEEIRRRHQVIISKNRAACTRDYRRAHSMDMRGKRNKNTGS